MLAISKICVQNAILTGQIPSQKYRNQVMIPADFAERVIFGDVDCVDLPLDSWRDD